MLNNVDLVNVLFLDIETVSGERSYDDLTDEFKKLWKLKARSVLRKYDEEITEEEGRDTYGERAGIFAEFGKICCISVGIITRDKDGEMKVRIKSYSNHDEKKFNNPSPSKSKKSRIAVSTFFAHVPPQLQNSLWNPWPPQLTDHNVVTIFKFRGLE